MKKPLLIYGKGKQKRTFLNINDTLQCIELALKNPAQRGFCKIRNQYTEIFSLVDLANQVKDAAKKININIKIKKIKKSVEKENHYYNQQTKVLTKLV